MLNPLAFIKSRWKFVAGLVMVGGALIFWLTKNDSASQNKLVFVKPEWKDLTKTLELSGVIDAKEKVRLRFLTGGKLTYVGVKEGQPVKKWQTVASIDQKLLNKQLEQQLNLYMKQRWDYEQYRDDYLENTDNTNRVVPELKIRRDADKEQWDLENSVLNVEMQDIAVKEAVLTSPIEGIVTLMPAAVAGTQLTAADYFEIVNPKTFVFKAAVDELDIGQVKLDQTAKIEFDAFPNQVINSKVSYISFASQQTATDTVFIIELPLTGQSLDDLLRLGMNGNATIDLETKKNVLVIPLDSTKQKDGKTFVDVRTTANKYEEREIVTGLQTEEETEVISGLSDQEEILLP